MPADNGATGTTLELHDYLVVIVKYMLCCVVGVKDSLARLTDTLCCHCRNILVLAVQKNRQSPAGSVVIAQDGCIALAATATGHSRGRAACDKFESLSTSEGTYLCNTCRASCAAASLWPPAGSNSLAARTGSILDISPTPASAPGNVWPSPMDLNNDPPLLFQFC